MLCFNFPETNVALTPRRILAHRDTENLGRSSYSFSTGLLYKMD